MNYIPFKSGEMSNTISKPYGSGKITKRQVRNETRGKIFQNIQEWILFLSRVVKCLK